MAGNCQKTKKRYNILVLNNNFMLYLASDHAGFQLKKYLEKYFANQSKTDYKDLGPESYSGNR